MEKKTINQTSQGQSLSYAQLSGQSSEKPQAGSSGAIDSPQIKLDEWVYVTTSASESERKAMAAVMSHSTCTDDSDQETSTWLDDLPVDKENSGVGFAYNQVYKEDAYKHQYHAFEDKCFRFKVDDNCYLYGVFDGHCGLRAAEFVSQRLPAEILLGQLDSVRNDDDVKQVLLQAYHTVECAYFATLDDLIAERTSLQQEIVESAKNSQLKADVVERLRVVDETLESGTSALVALILHGRLYIAHVGNSRALLCRTVDGSIRVEKLNDDHTLENESEVQRLAALGLPKEHIQNRFMFGQQVYTRCIGDYSVKGGYKDNELMSLARSDPVIAIPDLEDPVDIDPTCNFLLLMTDGAYRSLVDATNTDRVNADIASMVATEFARQSTLNGVGQAVVDRITRTHHDAHALSKPTDVVNSRCATRDDMTILIRNFNYRLRSQQVPSPGGGPASMNSSVASVQSPSTVTVGDGEVTPTSTMASDQVNPFFAALRNKEPLTNQSLLDTYVDSNNADSFADSIKSNASVATLDIDAEGRIAPYVSFDILNDALAKMSTAERARFEELMVPKMDCEPIEEHPEGALETASP